MFMAEKKKKPKFSVPNLGFFKSVKKRWRKPRGTANKKRMKYKFMGSLPKVGYKNSKALRGMHPSGKAEVLVRNLAELEAAKESQAVRIASGIGNKKRKLIEDKARLMKLFVVNMKFNGKAEPEGKARTSKN